MVDVVLGAVAVLVSFAISYGIIALQRHRPAETRGMMGLAATGVHLMLSLALPAGVWMAHKPASPLMFVGSVLVFYWLSLIILTLTIVRWLRAETVQSAKSPAAGSDNSNSRREDRL